MNNLKIWLKEIRANFLVLSIILVLYGTSVANWQGVFNLKHFLLALFGLVILHIAVNVLNEYYDFKSGLDFMTPKTPFSGGSGILPQGKLNPKTVCIFAVICCFIGFIIGLYFLKIYGTKFLPIIILGGMAVVFYTTIFSKIMLGEIFAGLGLGFLPVIGAYFVQTDVYSPQILLAAVPSGILTFNLLFLNEFPDMEADKKVGKRNFVITLGKKNAAYLYAVLTLLVYTIITIGVFLKFMPIWAFLSFLTLPIAIKAIFGAIKKHSTVEEIIPSLGANVVVVLLTQALLALGYWIAKITG